MKMTQPGAQPGVQTADRIKVRCPSCYKLYAVNLADVHEDSPRFECMDCHKRFWVSASEALKNTSGIIGFPMDWLETPATQAVAATEDLTPTSAKPFNCPKCGHGYAGGDTECRSCGLVFAKFAHKQEELAPAPSASRDVKFQWDTVLQKYESWAEHEAFIYMAQAERALDYAEYCYQQILRMNPSDAFAAKATQQIAQISQTMVTSRIAKKSEGDWKLSLPRLRLGTLAMFMCAIVIAIGFMAPGLTNLIGFGSAVLFALMTLRYYFRAI